jgi:hypothetical protein
MTHISASSSAIVRAAKIVVTWTASLSARLMAAWASGRRFGQVHRRCCSSLTTSSTATLLVLGRSAALH